MIRENIDEKYVETSAMRRRCSEFSSFYPQCRHCFYFVVGTEDNDDNPAVVGGKLVTTDKGVLSSAEHPERNKQPHFALCRRYEFGFACPRIMASGLDKAKAVALGIILFLSIGILFVSVVTLFKVGNKQSATPADATTTTTPVPDDEKPDTPPTHPTKATTTTTTTRPPSNGGTNIRPAEPIDPKNSKYPAFKSYADDLITHVNFAFDPCENFYEYTCANTQRGGFSFQQLIDQNFKNLLKGVKGTNNNDYAVKFRSAFNLCYEAEKKAEKYPKSAETIQNFFKENSKKINLPFPTLSSSSEYTLPSPIEMAQILAYLTHQYEVRTLLNYQIDTVWPQPFNPPHHHRPVYQLFIDQSKTFYPERYYSLVWDETKPKYKKDIKDLVNKAAKILKATVGEEVLEKDVDDAVEFEKQLALEINAAALSRKNFGRSYNLRTAEQMKNNGLVDFKEYISQISQQTQTAITNRVTNSTYEFVLMEPDVFARLTSYLKTALNPRVFYNYINYRFLLGVADYFPKEDSFGSLENDDEALQLKCLRKLNSYLPEAAGRIFVETVEPNRVKRVELKDKIGTIVSQAVAGFQTQLLEIDWLSPEAKLEANKKLKYVNRNIGYADWLDDDEKLNKFHEFLDTKAPTFLELERNLRLFNHRNNWNKLLRNDYDRTDWPPISAVNIDGWNEVRWNSVTYPYGILQRPFYDPNYPAAVNFGGIGHLAAHELIHAFDDAGVQWDSLGRLRNWLDEKSSTAFNEMVGCVSRQYGKFIPLEGMAINGRETVGENMADNGAVRAAFNSFQAYQEYYGQDPRLPDPDLGEFTHNQLFFLSFARVWCDAPTDDDVKQFMLVDNHSPSKYRVIGSLQNFPAFRAAFNCPIGSKYAPGEKCDVWVSDVKPARGVPAVPKEEPSLKIQDRLANKTETFKSIATQLSANLDLDVQACNDFHRYACGGGKEIDPIFEATQRVDEAVREKLQGNVTGALKKAKALHDTCKSGGSDASEDVKKAIEDLEQLIGLKFPLVNKLTEVAFSDLQLAKALSHLSFSHGINAVYKLDVQPNTQRNFVGKPYLFHISAPDAIFKKAVYNSGAVYAEYKDILAELLLKTLQKLYPTETADVSVADLKNSLAEIDYSQGFLTKINSRTASQRKYSLDDLNKLSYAKAFAFKEHFNEYRRILELADLKVKDQLDGKTEIVLQDSLAFTESLESLAAVRESNQSSANLVNYLYLRILLQYQTFLALGSKLMTKIAPSLHETPIAVVKEDQKACTDVVHKLLPPLYARAALDGIFGSREDFKKQQEKIAQKTQAIGLTFENLLNGLSWAPLATRQKLVRKVKGAARNIGAPDWVFDDETLTKAYEDLDEPKISTIIGWYVQVSQFKKVQSIRQLTQKAVQRVDFENTHSALVNFGVYTERDLNSINIPLSYLVSPVYDENNPQTWTFAFLANEIGKAYGHLFDVQGIEHDEYGQLNQLLDPESEQKLNEIFSQLLKYFSDAEKAKFLLDDIIADHTGLILAEISLRRWKLVHGDDGSLSDEFLGLLSSSQLFYYTYSQKYCKKEDPTGLFKNNVYLQKHLGNRRAFQVAFNCNSTQNYAPENRVDLWTSEATAVIGVPELPKLKPNLNIPSQPTSNSPKYEECANQFAEAINVNFDPCEDFYNYTCNRFTGVSNFGPLYRQYTADIYRMIKKPLVEEDPAAVKKAKRFFKLCMNSVENPRRDDTIIDEILKEFADYSKMPFPLRDKQQIAEYPSAYDIGRAIGYQYSKFGNSILISIVANANYKHPEKGLAFEMSGGFFLHGIELQLNLTEEKIVESAMRSVNRYLKHYSEDADQYQEELKKTATKIVRLEKRVFSRMQVNATKPRDFIESFVAYPVRKIQQLSTSIDFRGFVEGVLFETPDLWPKYLHPKQEVYVRDMVQLYTVLLAFDDAMKEKLVTPNDLYNYFYFNAIRSFNAQFLPNPPKPRSIMETISPRKAPSIPIITTYDDTPFHMTDEGKEFTEDETTCLFKTIFNFEEIASAMFVKSKLPTQKAQQQLQLEVAKIADTVLLSFRSMIDQVSWITKESRKQAISKLDNAVKNIAFTKLSQSFEAVDEYYKEVDFKDDEILQRVDYLVRKLELAKMRQRFKETPFDRHKFMGSPYAVNAWYYPITNGLTLPLGILQAPFYDREWPAAVNYGLLGVLAGHEIGHGFDFSGSQFNGVGAMGRWIDKESQERYDNMTDCVVNQYNNFCEDKNCVNGDQTKGENVADNGGIQAAFRAYRNAISRDGASPRLPNDLIGQFTSDQLFFLAFGRLWCDQNTPLAEYNDNHPPGRYRVLGSLQNFPAFREAFNCPIGSKYAPEERCDVWISDVEPSLGIPPTTTTLAPANLPSAQSKDSEKFNEVKTSLLQTIDVDESPCDNFYDYVCSNFIKGAETDEQAATRLAASRVVKALESGNVDIPEKKIINNYYSSCLKRQQDNEALKSTVTLIVDRFAEEIDTNFTLFETESSVIGENFFEKAIGALNGIFGIGSLIDINIEPNLETTEFAYPVYLLQFDEASLSHPAEIYRTKYQEKTKGWVTNEIKQVLQAYGKLISAAHVDYDKAAEKIYKLEALLSTYSNSLERKRTMRTRQNIQFAANLTNDYPDFDWLVLFQKYLKSASSAVRSKVITEEAGKPPVLNNEFILSIMNPVGLGETLKAWKNEKSGILPEDMVNYLYFKLLWGIRHILLKKPHDGLNDNLPATDLNTLSCALETRSLGPLHSKYYFEGNEIAFKDVQENVTRLTNAIINSLLTHIRQTTWASQQAKNAAIGKLENLQINAIGDTKIIQDNYIKEYFEGYPDLSDREAFGDYWLAQTQFRKGKELAKLLKNSVERGFDESPSHVTPYYNYITNTLTVPAGAASAPFFDFDYPLSANYGGLGIRIAHVLAHSLDAIGIQLDKLGHYSDWTDSKDAFEELTRCLKLQYSKFCPVIEEGYPVRCINNDEIVPENFADNIAIHVAYTAYQLAEGEFGADLRFNDNLLGQLGPEQTFFLGYTRQYCESNRKESQIFSQLITGKAIPSRYRVEGTLENYKAFQSAFHCPAGSGYVKEKPCEVFTGAGAIKSNLPTTNIRDKKQIDRSYPEGQLKAYQQAVDLFNYSMDLTADPCNDFYKYACGKYEKPVSFLVLRNENYKNQAQAIKNIDVKSEPSKALIKLREYYNQCITFQNSFPDNIKAGIQINQIVNKLQAALGDIIPTMFFKDRQNDPEKTIKWSEAIAHLQIVEGVDTFITQTIEVDAVEGSAKPGITPKMLYLDEATLVWPKSYYQEAPWKQQEKKYKEKILKVLKNFQKVLPESDADEEQLKSYVEKFARIELKLAKAPFATDETKRRKYTCHKYTVAELDRNFQGFFHDLYLEALLRLTGTSMTPDETYQLALKWPQTYGKFIEALETEQFEGEDAVVNYLFMRLLLANEEWIPNDDKIDESRDLEKICGEKTQMMMMYANGRAFADYMYKTPEGKAKAKSDVNKMIDNIRYQFQGMLDELSWAKSSKRFLEGKVSELQKNILYPEFSMDNARLDGYYGSYTTGTDFFDSTRKLQIDLKHHEYFYLTDGGKDYRDDFIQWPGTVNAWYEPFYNSLTIPEGIVQPPFYHADFPTSVNYGGLGVITGHELSHAFDDEGIQWDGIGVRNSTGLSPETRNSFDDMAQCIVDQYGSFQPLDPSKYSPSKLNGENTQGENIADNGGIHAAYRAYKNHVHLNGQEPQLPHPVLGRLSHDQLFFLAFAQVWCQVEAKPDAMHTQILVDEHSPSIYRVMGTVQNFPAFREAFNCPVNAHYTPQKHCSVWVPERRLV
ncbi:unnamed protein product [Bursaphelenchus xylophilus]|uniref:(pine wood nematode) hypothetical protein n=1 Tax=Bursaphelenchus xylophilus TaxID=6326 RepID=A0A1I7RW12_BURXY|nr:unnamed protein product [Bursaphelenchus xylophilus]CAG9094994.1 unnamed protein product [Bursaphelenchus xylophilus]